MISKKYAGKKSPKIKAFFTIYARSIDKNE